MKSERRHELHQNDLAQWLGKVAQWVKAHSNHITVGVLVVAVGFLAWVMIARHLHAKEDAVSDAYHEAMMMISEDEQLAKLKEVADQDRNPFLATKASLDVANLYAIKLITDDQAGAAARKEWADRATEYYTRAAKMPAKRAGLEPLAAQGYLGLGQLAADARNFDQAETLYKQAREMAPKGYPVHAYAVAELQELPKTRTAPEKFAATPPPTNIFAPGNSQNPLLPGQLTLPEIPYGSGEVPAPAPLPTETSEGNPE